ncbi:aminotransferase class I/II-fold pyridoxal phosphate-dependent enzyme [Streptomyces sp. NPDC053427]|uniref:aminotransferase class I/II-fold pyridoxal phosphate-dependent enzyme n=1 Tax=Streptomyces sp. NPDC053427 TaxID=3365701 RepID=UPI0037D760A2
MRQTNARFFEGTSEVNPYAPLPSALQAARQALDAPDRCRGPLCVELVAEIALRVGVSEDSIVLGADGLSLAFALLRSLMADAPGRPVELVVPHGGFDAYEDLARRLPAAHCSRVPLTPDGCQDLDALLHQGNGGRGVVFLTNPQDPTGVLLPGAELGRFLDRVSPETTVVLDEAHWEFVRDPDFTPGTGLLARHPRLVVLRSLSVVHGLDGLRVAYAACVPGTAELIQRQILPHDVGMVAQLVALASLRTPSQVRARTDAIVRERDRLREELRLLGFQVPPSQTHQLWMPLGADSTRFALACRGAGADVRLRPGEGVQVTVGPPELGDRVLRAAAHFIATSAAGTRRDGEVIDRI